MSFIAQELREARRQNVNVNRRLELIALEGIVQQRDEQKYQVRLALGEDPQSGETILSPWLSPLAGQSGAHRVSAPLPAIGDRMRMLSPSGVVGAASVAMPSTFDDELRRPSQQSGEAVSTLGKTRLSQTSDKIAAATEKTSVTQTADAIATQAETTDVKSKKTRLHVDSLDKLKIVLGQQAFALSPLALVPTSIE